jgi:hypothetical protein
MSAEIFNPPSEIKVPKLSFSDVEGYRKACDKFIEDLRAFLKKRKDGKNVGEVIKFPVADGYAMYMVASMKPLELVHIPLWDAWDFQYAHLLNAKEVQKKIDQEKALEELFNKNKK